jgi:16S rRNA (cytosine1402-N4)-methyltransferase
LLEESISSLITNQNGIYVDGTFGRGGHSRKILERISLKGSLFSYDLDPEAKLEAANINHSNFHFVHDNYRNIHLNFSDNSIDGVLLDCGVSSPQLDNPERGFSFKDNGPLDMRFNPKVGVSCAEIVNTFDEKDISKILWNYGEEKESRRIAKAIVDRRTVKGFTETKDLSELICSVKKRKTKKHPATKSFQALRIAVNDEIESLQDCLVNLKTKLKKGGRIVIISFHSLEDRIAKISFKEEVSFIEKKIPLIDDEPMKEFKVSKIIYPDEQELSNNIRSRSAKMRVIEKL